MATVSPVLRPDAADANGHRALRLRFADTRRTLYLALGVRLHPRFWNDRKAEVRKGHPHADRINGLVARRLAEAEDERLRLLTEGEPVTAAALRAVLVPETAAPDAGCLVAYARRFVDTLGARGNVGRFKREGTVLNKLEAWARGAGLARGRSVLPFDALTPHVLRDFEAHMIGTLGNKPSTALGNLKVIRTHYRRAQKEGLVPRESNPWDAFTPARAAKPERPKLSLAQVRALEALDLGASGDAGTLECRTRDAFLLSLYAAGMRFADVARLRVRDVIRDGSVARVVYEMGKTKKRADVRLVPQADRIVRAYAVTASGAPKPPDAFLMGMLDGYDLSTPALTWNAVSSQNALANKTLKRLATKATTDAVAMPRNLSFHVARHSFSDLARRSGWSTYDISKALAHSSLAQTETYLAGFDAAGLDAKMDGLFGEVTSPNGAAPPSDA